MKVAVQYQPYVASTDDPLAPEHADVSQWVEDACRKLLQKKCRGCLDYFNNGERLFAGYYKFSWSLFKAISGKKIATAKPLQACRYVMAALAQFEYWDKLKTEEFQRWYHNPEGRGKDTIYAEIWIARSSELEKRKVQALEVFSSLSKRKLPFKKEELLRILDIDFDNRHIPEAANAVMRVVKNYIEKFGIDEPLRSELLKFKTRALDGEKHSYQLKDLEKHLVTLQKYCDESFTPAQLNWISLFEFALTATTPRPSSKWLKTAQTRIEEIGAETLSDAFIQCFPEIAQGKNLWELEYNGIILNPLPLNSKSASDDCIRGLLWCVPLLPQKDELIRVISDFGLKAFEKIPEFGPRAPKVGNAVVYALSQIPSFNALGKLAMFKVRVKSIPAQKEIDKAFRAAATVMNVPVDEIEELGVPAYGLEEVGLYRTNVGEYSGELRVNGSVAALNWFDRQGKALKSVPAKVKAEHTEELKELKQSLKDLQTMLPVQRNRIESLFLLQKTWNFATWHQRYLQHPLIGTIANRIIWCVDEIPVLFHHNTATNLEGQEIHATEDAQITLWHPIDRPLEEVLGWRRRLEELQIIQPFKQAWREVYLLTDAERNTRIYSNRFAAHIVRQHQYHSLCLARGWKDKRRMCFDFDHTPATKTLPHWKLRAEYWVYGLGVEYGVDTNETGSQLYLQTDQVRFYPLDAAEHSLDFQGDGHFLAQHPGLETAAPVALSEIPPLVFSEIMRDVDLFVGVSSIGNDPQWQDGGPDGIYRGYWHLWSQGPLHGNAESRKQALENIVPKLKIASRCTIDDRFLNVQGDRHLYRIHIGSGNIFMMPSSRYLCIVPNHSKTSSQDIYLPFEGDELLTVILSKAFMLADDTKIKDPTILSQLK